jgi:hypothetical protein
LDAGPSSSWGLLLAVAPLVVIPAPGVAYSVGKLLTFAAGAVLACRARRLPDEFVLLLGFSCASAAWAFDTWASVLGIPNDWSSGVLGLCIVGLAWCAASPEIASAARVVACLVAALAFCERIWGGPLGDRAVATIGSPVHLGAYLALFVPGASLAALPFLVLGLIASGSRAAMIAAAVGLSVRRWWSAAIMLPIVVGVWIMRPAAVLADAQRLWAWRAAWAEPWTAIGVGVDNFLQVWVRHGEPGARYMHVYAHNDLLEAMVCLGFAGFAFYLVAWARALKTFWCPELAVLFVVAKLNPLPLEVTVTAAVLIATAGKPFILPPCFEPVRARIAEYARKVFYAPEAAA